LIQSIKQEDRSQEPGVRWKPAPLRLSGAKTYGVVFRTLAVVRAASAFLSTLVRRRPEASSKVVLDLNDDAPRATASSGLASGLPFTATQQAGVENRCPVCQARFRSTGTCSRCGANLEPLMRLAVRAWQLRQAARRALAVGDVERGVVLANEAQGIQDTGSGESLRLLGEWLKTVRPSSS
jgi:hypothetical protein